MDTCQTVYDFGRLLLVDQMQHSAQGYLTILDGWHRSRSLDKLCTASALFDSALHSVEDWRFLTQVEALYKKNADFSDNERCNDAAKAGFQSAERRCRRTNRRLEHYYLHPERLAPDMQFWLRRMEESIRQVLGPFSGFIEALPRLIKITDGASSTRCRAKALPYMKVGKRITATRGAAPYLQALSDYFGYGRLKIKPTFYNRVVAVPKNWKTHRTIAAEPDGNIPLQLAVDTWVKGLLRKKLKIDLSNQSRNQALAKEGSVNGTLATIDLSQASDTLAYNVVALLFPEEWFNYLDAIRVSNYVLPKEWGGNTSPTGRYAKFSSMGNGATFVVETLVFAVACKAVGSKRFSVYGDDIVIETELVPNLVRLLTFLGFVVNQEKSFVHGPFRESCGSHWYQGIYVTPFYVRRWREGPGFEPVLAHNVNGLVGVTLPFGETWSRLREHADALQKVPFNDVSTSGVWVTPHRAYRAGMVQTRHRKAMHIPRYKAYASKTGEASLIRDERTLFLWHLLASKRGPETPLPVLLPNTLEHWFGNDLLKQLGGVFPPHLVTSRVTPGSVKYAVKWVCWHPPAAAVPHYLEGWCGFLDRE